ncbi:LuxR C-terminal-related transcriptional regulator [Cryobacterium roopkundense]|uniref:LuxR C-terminal-related transcriptional regulator n=1 Tax=Cryobacterium roopkundense TaxID=1001240 RepID=UPI002286FA14|nr:LuxR C-terminal-related transcriptional regulator [Cryobacterium roopkundense]
MLALVANGHSNGQIGEALGCSPQAVKWHLARVMREWKVCNRASQCWLFVQRSGRRARAELASTRTCSAGSRSTCDACTAPVKTRKL